MGSLLTELEMESNTTVFYPTTKRPFVVLDTETTGLSSLSDELLEIAVIDSSGAILFHSYLTPQHTTQWDEAQAIHGITPEFIFSGGFPSLLQITDQLVAILKNKDVVLYNAGFDESFLKEIILEAGAACYDVMEPFSEWFGEWSDYHNSFKWQKLTIAATCVLFEWPFDAHTATGDALATLAVWLFLTDPGYRAAVEQEKHRRWEEVYINNTIKTFLLAEYRRQEKESWTKNQQAEKGIFQFLGITRWIGEHQYLTEAEGSANVFCQYLTGYTVQDWEHYGEYRLGLPRYQLADKPESLYRAKELCFLKTADERPGLVAMLNRKKKVLDLEGLYDLSQMQEGVDYVFWSWGAWPENCYSETSLRRQLKLKPKQIRELKPVYMRMGKKFNYLLYRYDQVGV